MPALTIGDPAPWFITPSIAKFPSSQDITIGGYRAVLFFFGSARDRRIQTVLEAFLAAQAEFEQQKIPVFGVSINPADQALEQRIKAPHLRFLWDFEGELSIRYGVCQLGDRPQGGITYDPTTFVLDENLRVLEVIPLETHIAHVEQVLTCLKQLPAPQPARLIQKVAPALFVPHVFPAEFCQELIAHYEANGGTTSGFMKQESDQAVVVVDPTIKRRRDWMITDATLLNQINHYIGQRVLPEIEKAFQSRITYFERYLVACYEDSTQGFFKAHRDNGNMGTAHRRFAMTLNLNDGYEGGYLRFPEYGDDLYSPEPGGAVIFSCSLLHEVVPVTQGRRFALLSFFYNDADAKLREQTRQHIVRKDGSEAEFHAGNQPIRLPRGGAKQPSPSAKASRKSPTGFQPKK
ncbi:MAG: hypothetical protein Kow00121_61040 [Elainellaceae cyanobacterium]